MPDREPRPYQFRLITLFLLTALLAVPLGLLFGDPSLVLMTLVEGVLLLLIIAWFLFIYGELNSDSPSQGQVAIATVMIVISLMVGIGLFWSTVRKQRPARPALDQQPTGQPAPTTVGPKSPCAITGRCRSGGWGRAGRARLVLVRGAAGQRCPGRRVSGDRRDNAILPGGTCRGSAPATDICQDRRCQVVAHGDLEFRMAAMSISILKPANRKRLAGQEAECGMRLTRRDVLVYNARMDRRCRARPIPRRG